MDIKSRNDRLDILERKILIVRKIYEGIKMENGSLRRKTDEEVKKKYGQCRISKIVRAKKLRWLRHVFGIPESRNTRKVLMDVWKSKNRRGRPNKM